MLEEGDGVQPYRGANIEAGKNRKGIILEAVEV